MEAMDELYADLRQELTSVSARKRGAKHNRDYNPWAEVSRYKQLLKKTHRILIATKSELCRAQEMIKTLEKRGRRARSCAKAELTKLKRTLEISRSTCAALEEENKSLEEENKRLREIHVGLEHRDTLYNVELESLKRQLSKLIYKDCNDNEEDSYTDTNCE